ncbi:hypothetical protein SH528x_002957 [Novipirellula sp. SH528]|uniref:hypothetical protein n=1 Tax=Novipirellula sp. SH528 TaxID=3454466 RepID=UPI003F9F9B84
MRAAKFAKNGLLAGLLAGLVLGTFIALVEKTTPFDFVLIAFIMMPMMGLGVALIAHFATRTKLRDLPDDYVHPITIEESVASELGTGAGGGFFLMAVAAVLFVGGIIAANRIYFYPPVMFVVGLLWVFKAGYKGSETGDVSGDASPQQLNDRNHPDG